MTFVRSVRGFRSSRPIGRRHILQSNHDGISEQRNGVSTYFHEGIKNAITQTNASQSVTATKRYNAFGLQVSSTGTWKSPFGYGGPWGYVEDGDAYGLKLLGHRYYDPSLGRFLSRDIAKSGRNWYAYCEGNPVGLADPRGLCVETVLDIIGVGMSLHDFVRDPSWENAAWLGADVAGAVIPFVPGTRFARKAAEGAEEAVECVEQLGRHGDDLVEAAYKAAREGSPGAHCFIAGTQVEMADGTPEAIESVKTGDQVKSVAAAKGSEETERVSRTFVSEATVLTTVVLSDGQQITSTIEHPYFVVGKGWTAASSLRPLDRIASERGDAVVQKSWTRNARAEVYNLEVADTHTYLVGREGVLVHNLCAWPSGGSGGHRFRGAGDGLPARGGPKGGSLVSETSPGKGTIRYYDEEGCARVDYDFGHDDGFGDPHAHDWHWDFSGAGPKAARVPRRLYPGE